MEYNILARSGSNGPLVQKLFWEFGFSCENTITPNTSRIQNVVLVTYGYDLFPYVMTSHLLEVVGDTHARGDKGIWDMFKVHYTGPGEYTDPNDITPEHWAEHVNLSMKFIIGQYDLFNGSEESLLREIEGYSGPKYTVTLEDILSKPKTVLNQISKITGEPIPDGLLDYYKQYIKNQQLRLNPYLEAYKKIS